MIQETAQPSVIAQEPDPDRRAPGFWRRLLRNRLGFASLMLIALVVLASLLGPLLYSVDPAHTDFGTINALPSLKHPLGTDRLGHDTLARLLEALRVSLLVAAVV